MIVQKLVKNELVPKFLSENFNFPKRRIIHLLNFTVAVSVIVLLLKVWLYMHGIRLSSFHGGHEAHHSLFSKRLLDLDHFEWIANNKSICELNSGTNKLLPILVSSARNHFSERQAIRNTYGSLLSYKDWSVRTIFLLGTARDDERNGVSSKISDEIQTHGDMIVGNFVDTYRNLTYKHIMGYRWILEHCPQATFVWKVDDDIFLDPLSVTTWRGLEIKRNEGLDDSSLTDFYCPIQEGAEPQRDKNLKWYVSYELWPHSKYPTYCSGWGYGISIDWIRKIYVESLRVKGIFWIDDMFVTGILVHWAAQKSHRLPIRKNIWNYTTFRYDPSSTTFCGDENARMQGQTRRRLFGVMGRLLRGEFLTKEMKCVWDSIVSGKWRIVNIH